MIGIMTAGGDCPGLNAVIRAIVRTSELRGAKCLGIRNGWQGLMEHDVVPLERDDVSGIARLGGTILGTSRMDPYVHGTGYGSIAETMTTSGMESVIVIGGDGTLRTALALSQEGLRVVGVPKTIDNDIAATDVTFGFHTAVQVASDAIDRLTTTADSHNRVILVEVMGRTAGWLAAYAGIAGGADVVLVPEVPYELDAVADLIRKRHARGRRYSIVVVAEGVTPPPELADREKPLDAFGFERLGGIANELAPLLEARTGFETRVTVLGHVQRGGTPTAFDRVLASRLGVAAAELSLAGESGVMTSVRGPNIESVPLFEACERIRTLDKETYHVAETFFG